MTVVIEFPPGDPAHGHPGPAFGSMLDGELPFVGQSDMQSAEYL